MNSQYSSLQLENLRKIPNIDFLLHSFREEFPSLSEKALLPTLRKKIEEQRKRLQSDETAEFDLPILIQSIREEFLKRRQQRLQKVLNGTGVILHTNLGRACLSELELSRLREICGQYCNLELDLSTGKRGSRGSYVHQLLCELSGAEDALVVNNNASAVFLVLMTFGKGKEVILSRGELVEIGGSFRIPDVMEASGAKLVEVGTTNRTYVSDYESAISEATSMLVKVHPSNYSIRGFSSEISMFELAELAKKRGVISYFDMGCASFEGFASVPLSNELNVLKSLKTGVDLVSFSGDKLLGSCQAGILLGKAGWIQQLKKNPLYRAFRVGKLTLSVLEAKLETYFLGREEIIASTPFLRDVFQETSRLEAKAKLFQKGLEAYKALQIREKASLAMLGGGTSSMESFPSIRLGFEVDSISANQMESQFRHFSPPVLGVIEEGIFWLDLLTLREEDLPQLIESIRIWLERGNS